VDDARVGVDDGRERRRASEAQRASPASSAGVGGVPPAGRLLTCSLLAISPSPRTREPLPLRADHHHLRSLALGLNVVVGFAGLLDLGWLPSSASALLTESWPAAIRDITCKRRSRSRSRSSTALVGLLLGLTSWRLLGDYLAIATLFFPQAFVIFVTTPTAV
jgi:hypothetical protein